MAGGGGSPIPEGLTSAQEECAGGGGLGRSAWGQGHSQRPRVPGGPSLGPSTSALTWPSEGKGNRQGREELIFPKRWARGPPRERGFQTGGEWGKGPNTISQISPRPRPGWVVDCYGSQASSQDSPGPFLPPSPRPPKA